LPGFKKMGALAEIMSTVSNAFRTGASCKADDVGEATKNLLGAVKSALGAVKEMFPGFLKKVELAGKVVAKSTPVLGVIVSGMDHVISCIKQHRARGRGDEVAAAMWEIKSTMDLVTGMAQMGVAADVALTVPSGGVSVSLFPALEATSVLMALVCEIVAHIAETPEEERKPGPSR